MFTHDIVTFVHYYIVSKYIVEISLKKNTFCMEPFALLAEDV